MLQQAGIGNNERKTVIEWSAGLLLKNKLLFSLHTWKVTLDDHIFTAQCKSDEKELSLNLTQKYLSVCFFSF